MTEIMASTSKNIVVLKDLMCDCLPPGATRPVSSLSFQPSDNHYLAVSYCNTQFLAMEQNLPKQSFIFDIRDSTTGVLKLEPPSHVVSLRSVIYIL